jgi:peroxiredoxin
MVLRHSRRLAAKSGKTGGTSMISVGQKAPGFELPDHLGRKVKLERFTGKSHVMLLFYPLDFTPT